MPDAVHFVEDARQYLDPRCLLLCACGFRSEGDTWASAGVGMDRHLEGVLEISGMTRS